MPETQETGDKTPKPRTTTLDNPIAQLKEAEKLVGGGATTGERYVPSGITADGYGATQIRRLEVYQRVTIVSTLRQIGIESYDDVEAAASDEAKMQTIAHYLQTCLVGPKEGNGPAHLFRKGKRGLAKLQEEVTAGEIAKALRVALEQVKAFG